MLPSLLPELTQGLRFLSRQKGIPEAGICVPPRDGLGALRVPVQGKDPHTTQLSPTDQAIPIAHGMPDRCLMVVKLVAMLAV